MLLSFVYLAFSAVLQLLMGSRRSEFAKMSSCSFCAIGCWCFVGSSRGRRFGQPIAPSWRRSAGCSSLDVGTG